MNMNLGNLNVLPMLVLGVLFMVVSHHQTYEFVANMVNSVLPDLELVDENGQPTMLGQALHAVVLVVVVYVLNANFLEGANRVLVV